MTVNYKEQVIITDIKLGMQYLICQIFPEKNKNLCKTRALRTHKSTKIKIVIQNTNE